MHLSNILNSEADCVCLHEGKFRDRERSGEQKMPFLTLENRIAYEYPDRAEEIIRSKRGEVDQLDIGGAKILGDIAYNYCPFIVPLARHFPEAKFIVMYRDGRAFVRSATLLHGEDKAPVGWPPENKPLTDLEKYISLGRLQPRKSSSHCKHWNEWGALNKNIWLWAETNKLILDSLSQIPAQRYKTIKFEDFVASPLETYGVIRDFLGLPGDLPNNVRSILQSRKINARSEYSIPPYEQWGLDDKNFFEEMAGDVMSKLGYWDE